jgi:hypothetical protein
MKDGDVQGDFGMIAVGPYDVWAIEYGYTFAKDLKPILARSTEPEHQFGTDQDTMGPDPLARRYDFSANPLDYAKSQMKLAKHHRERMITKFVVDGDSWSKARRGYELTLMLQTRSLSMMSNWVGGAFVHRDHKGDKAKRTPIEAVSVSQQREAIKWVVANAFQDDAFGLNAQFLQRLRRGIRAYLREFALGNADWPDFARVLTGATGADIAGWGRQWIDRAGRPRVVVAPYQHQSERAVRDQCVSEPSGRRCVMP